MEQFITNNIIPQNNDLEILKNNFPNCFDKDENFDFDKFKTQLQYKEIDFTKESYGIDWLGKSYARLLACDPSTTLLTEDKTWNQKIENINSQNILIKGDNLEVLKHLANAYHQKIKMIYIDPPYNTGSDNFIYQDDRQYTIQQIKQLAGVEEEKAKKIHSFINSKSNSHSAWLTFMYPRLYIARQLLKNDGVIFISIDDNEVAQLKLLMDEIFGEENFVANVIVVNNLKGRNDATYFKDAHEYIVVYKKQNFEIGSLELNDEQLAEYNLEDEYGIYKKGKTLQKTGDNSKEEDRPNLYYPIYVDKENNIYTYKPTNKDTIEILPKREMANGCWTWGKTKVENEKHNIFVSRSGDKITFYVKQRLELDGITRGKYCKSVLYKPEYNTGAGVQTLNSLLNTEIKFKPKSLNFIKDIIKISTSINDTILDFFAGSGTTADAVMQLNAEDLGNRNFILVQIPELIDQKKNKTAYDFVKQLYENEPNHEPTIFDITKERIVRASQKIKTENIDNLILEKSKEIEKLQSQLDIENKEENIEKLKNDIEKLKNQDLGFKIFETIPIWENYNLESTKFNTDQKLFDEKILTPQDIETLLTTWKTFDNIQLTQNLKPIDLDGYTSYYFANKLYLMHKGFETKNLISLLEQIDRIDNKKYFQPSTIIAFGYNFESKNLREISENIVSYRNKKSIEMDFIIRY